MAKRDDSVKKKVPELRFKGFTDDWEERKIKDIFKITRGQVLAATEISEEKSDISPFPVYSSQTKNNGLMGYYKDYLFDTAITWTTDGANAGTVSYRSGRFYSTNVNGVLISDKGYTNKAISEILNLEAWKWVSHVGNPKLMNNVMGDISIMIPSSFEEQDRLSDFLNQLDDTIALHQRKLDLLKEQKKGFLQKMFPKNGEKVPELRFAGFADDWEQRRLGEECQITMGQSPNGKTYSETPSDYILVQGNADLKDGWVFPRVWTTQKTKTAKAGDLILSVRAPVGTIGKTAYDVVIGRGVASIKGNEFIYQLLTKMNLSGYWTKLSAGSTFESINSDSIQNALIFIPPETEQQQIGAFFAHLDTLISLHQRKLDLLKEQKKGFLQKMFV
ncbi:restriction endonuclease subunit S [uncultured Streptococcus sp.]|uniref:restriction endonuclease subunit S n=1 Tax=uncultured Streptococcus sp. TaxID=83427 RepID=UPI002711E8BA|nr:restriction endonuclease subunit S [uncultured Streptococcus sp.]